MNIEIVNELIASLESAGELSIKETKVMALAKAYQQLAVENIGLKGALTGSAYISFIKANGWNTSASTVNGKFVNFADPEVDFGSMVFAHAKKLIEAVETPATDAFLAGIKADGVEEMASIYRGFANKDGCSVNMKCSYNLTAERAESYAAYIRHQMLEGADK